MPKRSRMLSWVFEAGAVVGVPAVLLACLLLHIEQTALISLCTVVASVLLFFSSFEVRAPRLRDVMPVAVLAALAAAGRILFAPIPDFKPISAIAIIAGVAFGRRSGFMVGALAALVSNFFFGQGPWTPWQMYAWGMVGYGAGVLAHTPLFVRTHTGGEGVGAARLPGVCAYGFVSALGYGLVLNLWSVLGFFHPQTFAEVIALYAAAVPFDIMHGAATVVFLLALYKPLVRKLARVRAKYGLCECDTPSL